MDPYFFAFDGGWKDLRNQEEDAHQRLAVARESGDPLEVTKAQQALQKAEAAVYAREEYLKRQPSPY